MPLPRTSVEYPRDPVALRLRQRIQIYPLVQILTDQTVGVLVGSAFPRMVRVGEVKLDAAPRLDLLVSVEFAKASPLGQ